MSNVTIEDNTDEALSELKSAIHRALETIGQVAVKEVSARTPVDTGRLRASNDYELQGDNTVVIGNVQEYAPYVEYGTRHQKAQPYLKPGVEESQGKFKEIIEHEMRGQ